MSKHKSDSKKKKKESQLVIRLTKEERDAFVTLCKERDTSAAREIRRFMREWVAGHAKAPILDAEQPSDGRDEADRRGATCARDDDQAAFVLGDPAAADAAETRPANKPKARRRPADR